MKVRTTRTMFVKNKVVEKGKVIDMPEREAKHSIAIGTVVEVKGNAPVQGPPKDDDKDKGK